MIKETFLFLCTAAVVSLAACTTKPAMAPSHIAALHSGRMVVAVPKRSFITLTSPRNINAGDVSELVVWGVLFGAVGGGFAEGNVAAHMQARQWIYADDLGPYSKLFWFLYPKQRFMHVARSVVRHVDWMGKDPSVKLYGNVGAPNSGNMSHLAQSADTQAVVFVTFKLGFSGNMETLTAVAQVDVYAKGLRRGQLIDGGTFKETTRLINAGPPLKLYGYEGIAAGTKDDRAVRGARANVWMQNGGKRYKTAVASDLTRLKADLTNFLDGRPTSH